MAGTTFTILLVGFISLHARSAGLNASLSPLRVSLHVFSGRPDPVWVSHPADTEYQNIYRVYEQHLASSTTLPSRLGYKGFTVSKQTPDGDAAPMVTIARCSDPRAELDLLNNVVNLVPEGQTQPVSVGLIDGIRADIQGCP